MIVSTKDGVTLIGGGECGPDDLSIALKVAGLLVAADGGAAAVLAAGLRPEAVIGDLDSLPDDARAAFGDVLVEVKEQDTTDFEKCLQRIKAPLVVAVGFLGGRLDHTLAVLNTLARHAGRTIILIGGKDVCAVVPQKGLQVQVPVGTRVSLMPLGPAVCRLDGVRWPLADAALAPDGATSISNEATGAGPVRMSSDGPVLVVLPRAEFTALVAGLVAD